MNDAFLKRYCSEKFAGLMARVDEKDREYVLSGISERHWFNGTVPGNDSQDIWLDVGEIETQFEGEPEDYFAVPSEFTIKGGLAYLYVGYGFSIKYDLRELEEAIVEHLS